MSIVYTTCVAVASHVPQDLFDAMGPTIDGVKFAGGAVMAMQRQGVEELVNIAHEHGAYASCAGGVELAWDKACAHC